MKIKGMEAISLSIPKINSGDTTTSSNSSDNTPILKEIRSIGSDVRNISQISDFERRELPISEKVVIDAIEKANRAISGANRKFEFSIHEKTKEIMIKVIDSDTNQVIREIPNEKILDMVAKMWEMAGLIVDERR